MDTFMNIIFFLFVVAACIITAKERIKNPPATIEEKAENENTDSQIKQVTNQFKWGTTISLFGLFAISLLSTILAPSRNEGSLLQFFMTTISFISAIISLSSFVIYNFLFSAKTNLRASLILAIPFSGLILCLFPIIVTQPIGIAYAFFISAPFILIYTIMRTKLLRYRNKFHTSFDSNHQQFENNNKTQTSNNIQNKDI